MSNNRIYYPCEAVGISPFQATPAWTTVRGVQTVGVNTKINLDRIFELSQLAVYGTAEGLPDVEITAEKVLDGYPLMYHSLTQGAATGTLVGRSAQRAHMAFSIFADTNATASGNQVNQCFFSGVYVSQVGYDVEVNGQAKESVTVVGNNKVWSTGSFTFSGYTAAHGVTSLAPAAPSGVNERQHVMMASCLWPSGIPGISASGTNDPVPGSGFSVHVQKFSASTNLGRDTLLELGSKREYFRYVKFPVTVNTSIDVMSTQGDLTSVTEDGIYAGGYNSVDEHIYFVMEEGLKLDLGTHNRLVSVGMSGGGTDGNNQTLSYSYENMNDFTVVHPADPTVGLRG